MMGSPTPAPEPILLFPRGTSLSMQSLAASLFRIRLMLQQEPAACTLEASMLRAMDSALGAAARVAEVIVNARLAREGWT